jgi:hypothetical protein
MWRWFFTFLLAGLLVAAQPATQTTPNLEIRVPATMKVKSAKLIDPQSKLEIVGKKEGQSLKFANLLPNAAYDAVLTLEDGKILRGVNLGWYTTLMKAQAEAKPMEEEDHDAILDLFNGIQAFENKRNLLKLSGNHDHATALVDLIRDTEFHSAKGGEIIWRVELWYFKYQHGGWEKVSQQNMVLYRERFKSQKEFDDFVKPLRFVEELGGLKAQKGEGKVVEWEPGSPDTAAGG